MSEKNLPLRGMAGQKVSKPSKIFVTTLEFGIRTQMFSGSSIQYLFACVSSKPFDVRISIIQDSSCRLSKDTFNFHLFILISTVHVELRINCQTQAHKITSLTLFDMGGAFSAPPLWENVRKSILK